MRKTILLTSSIDPNGCSFLTRGSIEDRKNDYLLAVEKWLTGTSFDIVYVDNSGYDLGFIIDRFSENSSRIEFLSYDGNGYDRALGKGYGELEIINYALTNSSKISSCDHLIKSTGRYFFPKMESFLDGVRLEDYDFVGLFNEGVVHTGFFAVDKSFYLDFIGGVGGNPVNDTAGYYIEHLFYNMAFSTERRLLIDTLGAEGISGTFGTDINWM